MPLPLSIGRFAAWAGAEVAGTQAETLHFQQLSGNITVFPLRMLLVALVLGIILQSPVRRLVTRIDLVWYAAVASITVVAARAAWQTWLWAGNPSRQLPEDYIMLFSAGLICAWIVWWLTSVLRFENEKLAGLRLIGWCLFAVAASGFSHIAAADSRPGGPPAAVDCGSDCRTGVDFRDSADLSCFPPKAVRHLLARSICALVLLLVLVMPLPLAGQHISPVLYGFRLLSDSLVTAGNHLYGYIACIALVAACFALWPFERRRKMHTPRS